jgi:hypothetical protein
MKWLIIAALPVLLFTASCKKEKKVSMPVPFLTGRKWMADTITINLPATFSQLSTADQQQYSVTLAWWRIAELTFNEDGSVTGGGSYDFGYYKWRMINNNADIEMLVYNGTKDTLFNWSADNLHFTYSKRFSPSYNCTYVYK